MNDDKPTLTVIDGGLTDPNLLLDDRDLEPDTADLAWIAQRLILTHVNAIDFSKLAAAAGFLFDEADVSTVKALLRNAKVSVEVPVLPVPLEAVSE